MKGFITLPRETGPHPKAYNEPGGRSEVSITSAPIRGLAAVGALEVPAMSVTLHELALER